MRIISAEMAEAVRNHRTYKKSNTVVSVNDNNELEVYLFENKIANIVNETITYTSCGWHTITTKERLNALMPEGYCIVIRKAEWYIQRMAQLYQTGEMILQM